MIVDSQVGNPLTEISVPPRPLIPDGNLRARPGKHRGSYSVGVQVPSVSQRHEQDSVRFPWAPNGIPRGLSQNFKTSNGRLKTLATSIRGRLWKVCFLGPRHGSVGFPVLCDDPERVS